MKPYFEDSKAGITIYHADCREALPGLIDASFDSIVCDPPYELGFMGKGWDRSGIAYDVSVWRECLRVLKPGGHLLAFGGSRTYHRLACAIEDSGFEIRDQIQWIYGSGFPKSLDISKAIDAASGAGREVIGQGRFASRRPNGIGSSVAHGDYTTNAGHPLTVPATDAAIQWDGWGTALKPAHEPIVLARKPLIGNVAENVLQHGTGGLNIDGCRIETGDDLNGGAYSGDERRRDNYSPNDSDTHATLTRLNRGIGDFAQPVGRWPANVIHDGSDEVLAGFPETQSGGEPYQHATGGNAIYGAFANRQGFDTALRDGNGSAARFFYCAKASKADRGEGNTHPTVKPTKLMRYLCRLVTPPNGVVLDPFGGSGSTAKACRREGFRCVLIEKELEYCQLSKQRLAGQVTLNFEAVA